MTRRQLERHLREHGCVLHHHGAKHDVWVNPNTLSQAPVPRHNQIKRGGRRGSSLAWPTKEFGTWNRATHHTERQRRRKNCENRGHPAYRAMSKPGRARTGPQIIRGSGLERGRGSSGASRRTGAPIRPRDSALPRTCENSLRGLANEPQQRAT